MSAIPTTDACRTLRSDARRNYERLIAAANAAFREQGARASLEDIAKRAQVGIGTLYRHFPNRDDLIAKVIAESTVGILARAQVLLDADSAGAALAQWLRELVSYVTTFRGLTGALATSYVGSGTELCSSCETLTEAGGALLARAQAAGEIRSDAEIREVILTAHSAAWIAEQTQNPAAADRLLGILFDGLRTQPSTARSASKLAQPRRTARSSTARSSTARSSTARSSTARPSSARSSRPARRAGTRR